MSYELDLFNSPSVVTTAGAVPTKTPKDGAEVVAATYMQPGMAASLPRASDDLQRMLSPRVYAQMLTDPAVQSSFGSLKLSIIAGGMKLVSPVKQPARSKRVTATKPKPTTPIKPGKAVSADTTLTEPAAELTPEQAEAKEVYEFCERNRLRVMQDIRAASFGMLDAMAWGVKLAEVTYEVPEDGPDAGKMCLKSVKVKPNRSWAFVVDNAFNVLGVLTQTPGVGLEIWPPEKFAWLSWMPRDGDPRGTSQLRAAHAAWNLKVQTWPEYYAHLRRFGSGGIDYEMAEGEAVKSVQPLNADGTVNTAADPVPITTYYVQAFAFYKNGGSFVHPQGSKFTHWEPQNNGEAFLNAFRIFDEQITLAIKYQFTAAMDSKHSSRAQSQTGQDVTAPVVQYGRDELAMPFHSVFRQLVTLNFGADVAERCTPMPSFGNAEAHDRAPLWTAAGSIGYALGDSQMEEMDEELGLPVRDKDADAALAQQAMAEQTAMLAEAAPAPAPGGKGPPAGNDKGVKP